jgi:hypothetical protein
MTNCEAFMKMGLNPSILEIIRDIAEKPAIRNYGYNRVLSPTGPYSFIALLFIDDSLRITGKVKILMHASAKIASCKKTFISQNRKTEMKGLIHLFP